MTKLVRLGVAAGLVSSALLAGAGNAQPKSKVRAFDAPVLLTPVDGIGGFEPSLAVDFQDNIWATAHRTDGPVSPHEGATAGVRSGSWLWFSADGRTFTAPRTAGPVDTHDTQFGLEGDLATDAQGNVHFVDLGVGKVSFSSWHADAPGRVTPVRTSPSLAAFSFDRPFISASGGTVLFAVNDLVGSPLAPPQADLAAGQHQGAMSFYVSRDGGATFSLTGAHPAETGFCRPHVSRRDSRVLVAACTGQVLESVDDDTVDDRFSALTSRDGGATWSTTHLTEVFPNTVSGYFSFPSVAETSDGRIHLLFTRMSGVPGEGVPRLTNSSLVMTTSADGGRTWSRLVDVSPEPGLWQHASLAADRSGRLGIAGYYQSAPDRPWSFRAATWRPGRQDIVSTEVVPGLVAYSGVGEKDAKPQGEFTQAAFDSRGRLNVVFSVREASPTDPAGDGKRLSSSRVYFARQR